MTVNKKTLVTGLVTAVPALMITASGIMKLLGSAEIRDAMSKAGAAELRVPLGLMELAFTALFIFPRTMKLGLLLLTSYFAGAIATDLTHGKSPGPAVMILTLVWIAAFVRDRSAFLPAAPAHS
ncbi:DoxX family protein [Hymenobacter jeollabukensis]|uniref:DoxX family protein n=1 Tax=Hymenobacter jeollabukensis TaxID=2025313 RepID=A0A5R8WQ87_9BACT|nr:DoxX family protein [Hymenobacter jeollabukensis]TLM91861.1 DoxX family protein [Hymenobacter jeollabukensis]